MKVNIGKNTLGDSEKMSISLKEYGRSTHDLSCAWRSPMGVGTLVPFMKLVGLPGDTFEIDLDTQIMTHPTIGPLFGSFKFQADVFTCPIRLYNAMLHNNTLNIGLDMSKVKLPVSAIWTTPEGKMGKGSLAEYMGIRKQALNTSSDKKEDDYQIVPFLAYYDIFKNYYANKQEEHFYVMGGSLVQGAKTVSTTSFTGNISTGINKNIICTTEATATITGQNIKISDIKKVKFTIDSEPIYMNVNTTDVGTKSSWDIVSIKQNEIVIKTKKGNIYELSRELQGKPGDSITLKGATETIAQGTKTDSYTSKFPLTEIDDLREYILSKGREQVRIGRESDERLKSLFIYNVLFTPNPEEGPEKLIPPIVTKEMGGLCLKTYQSDLFNNWVNKDWVDGDNGINAVTDVDVSDGKLNLDALNLAQKVYNMLNRIAISGGSYKDWIETVYTTDYYFRAETPVYEGGMSTTIDFEAVVSNSASTASGVEEPLGSLAGRGFNQGKRGGQIVIKCNEPCYIIGIASITPNVDYSQGNDWDIMQLKTMDDLHKPQMDGIGYQDLLSNQMHGRANLNDAIGKQPAWLNYMTDVNKTYADFAAGEPESYMVLNRIYDVDESTGKITNPSTYISPKDYTYIFATNTDTNRDFWVQIGKKIIARRVMSAAQIPLM